MCVPESKGNYRISTEKIKRFYLTLSCVPVVAQVTVEGENSLMEKKQNYPESLWILLPRFHLIYINEGEWPSQFEICYQT